MHRARGDEGDGRGPSAHGREVSTLHPWSGVQHGSCWADPTSHTDHGWLPSSRHQKRRQRFESLHRKVPSGSSAICPLSLSERGATHSCLDNSWGQEGVEGVRGRDGSSDGSRNCGPLQGGRLREGLGGSCGRDIDVEGGEGEGSVGGLDGCGLSCGDQRRGSRQVGGLGSWDIEEGGSDLWLLGESGRCWLLLVDGGILLVRGGGVVGNH